MEKAGSENEYLEQTIITGANGMVGHYADFGIKLNREELDVTDSNMVFEVCEKYKPKAIIHLAAETDLSRCEEDPKHAYFVNAVGTYNIAVAARNCGAKFVYVSTSGVFDGKKRDPYIETDVPNPVGHYEKSKYMGELFVQQLLSNYVIARISWVFGGGPDLDQKFISKIIKQLNQPEICVVAEKYGSPTYGKDVIEALKDVVIDEVTGIIHLSNTGVASRTEVVQEIVRITGSETKIAEVDDSYFSASPKDSGYINQSMTTKEPRMRDWRQALQEYVRSEWSEYIKI